MQMNYDPATDSLYIHLSERISVDSDEVVEGVVLDYAEDGSLAGIDLQQASKIVDMDSFELRHLPLREMHAA